MARGMKLTYRLFAYVVRERKVMLSYIRIEYDSWIRLLTGEKSAIKDTIRIIGKFLNIDCTLHSCVYQH